MKRLFTLFYASVFVAQLFALPRDKQAAQAIAENTLTNARGVKVAVEPLHFSSQTETRIASYSRRASSNLSAPAYYLFKASDGNGFVIVSGEDAMPALVGYSPTGMVSDADDMPDALVASLGMYEMYVEAVRKGEVLAPAQTSQPSASTSFPSAVQPLLTCTWGQDSPFNLKCPTSGNKRVPCGCAATAMSQIMYYWKWPAQGRGSNTYNNGEIGGVISSDFSQSYYNWSVMGDDVDSNKSPEAQEAVSTLCYDCGVSIAMQYNLSGSGAYTGNTLYAFANNFRYRASTLKYIERDCYSSDQAWLEDMKTELAEGRPIFMGAMSPAGGHAFVLDGYDTSDFVHVNWGWSGRYNGFYDITVLNTPNFGSFATGQEAIVGIMPDESGTDTHFAQCLPVVKGELDIIFKSKALGSKVSIQTVIAYNMSMLRKTYTFGVGLFDAAGNFLEDVSGTEVEERTVTLGGGGKGTYLELSLRIPEGYTPGDYILRIISREQDFDEWVVPNVLGGADVNNLMKCYIENGKIYFNQSSTSIDAPIVTDSFRSGIYDLQGRRLTTDYEKLPHGLYIIDGKKVLK